MKNVDAAGLAVLLALALGLGFAHVARIAAGETIGFAEFGPVNKAGKVTAWG